MSDKLIVTIDQALKNDIDEWFKAQPLRKLVELPFEQVVELHANNNSKAFKFFRTYCTFMEKANHARDYPAPYYKAKKSCCHLALSLGCKKITSKEQGIQTLDSEEWDFAVRNWIHVCYLSAFDKKVESVFLTIPMSAETELKRVLLDGEQRIRPEFKQNIEKFELYFRKLIDWFLSRYDLPMAAKLMWTLRGVKKKQENAEKSQHPGLAIRAKRAMIRILIFALFIVLPVWLLWELGFPGFDFLTDVINPVASTVRSVKPAWPPQIFTTVLVALYPALLLMTFSATVILATGYMGILLFLKLLIPRLTASIVVGYLPLVMSGDAWNALNGLEPANAFLLILAMLLFSFLFLFLEVNNRVDSSSVAFKRSFVVFLVGLLQSFIIGLIVSDWITTAFSVRANIDAQALPYGLFGHIAPQVLVLMFPFALFIGFFVQLIWQDKAVTQPL